jgi:hypothetical protein
MIVDSAQQPPATVMTAPTEAQACVAPEFLGLIVELLLDSASSASTIRQS